MSAATRTACRSGPKSRRTESAYRLRAPVTLERSRRPATQREPFVRPTVHDRLSIPGSEAGEVMSDSPERAADWREEAPESVGLLRGEIGGLRHLPRASSCPSSGSHVGL